MPLQRMAKRTRTGAHTKQKSNRRSVMACTLRPRHRFGCSVRERVGCASVGTALYSEPIFLRNILSGIQSMAVVVGIEEIVKGKR